jgi:predicted DNA-binding transcriptional regulator AlpA
MELNDALRLIVREEIGRAGRPKSELITRIEAAAFLGLKPQTLAVWAMRNVGPAPVKIGSLVRYKVEDLDAYITTNTMPR